MTNFINNKWQEGQGEKFQSISPVDGRVLWEGKASTYGDVDAAIFAAREALNTWKRYSFERRKKYAESFVEIVKHKRDFLVRTLCLETGKVILECEAEISALINKFQISVSAYEDRCKDLAKDIGNTKSLTRHKPHGVIAVFGPYNFPAHVPNGHITPALLAGNTLILKPSDLTPLISEEIIKCWEETGLPYGVINLVQGKSETGVALSKHDGLDGIFFTGSSRVGKILHENYAGKLGKVLALELGGNNPLIVWDNKDSKKAIDLIIQSAFSSNGQRCTCARRLILKDSTFSKKFLNDLVDKIKELKIGDPLNPESFMGPLISKEQADKMLAAQASLVMKGAEIILESVKLDLGDAYISPALIDCSSAKELVDEEYFGPMLQVYRVKEWADAIELANSTEYGLSAGLISESEKLYEEFFYEIEAGLVNWNNQITGASSATAFGGCKMSGNHNPSGYYAADYCSYPVATMIGE